MWMVRASNNANHLVNCSHQVEMGFLLEVKRKWKRDKILGLCQYHHHKTRSKGKQTFSIKDQVINSLGFAGQTVCYN